MRGNTSHHHAQVSDFQKRYEERNTPVVIRGMPDVKEWKAWTEWRLPDMLEKGSKYYGCRYGFKVGGGEIGDGGGREEDEASSCSGSSSSSSRLPLK